MNNPAIIEKTMHLVHLAQQGEITNKLFFRSEKPVNAQHEFLFFIKPEITLSSASIQLKDILELVFGKLDEFSLQIRDIRILTASYLQQYDIIAQHYGVINALSRKPLEYLSKEAREKFRLLYGKDPEAVTLMGSIEWLSRFPGYTPFSLDDLWQSRKTEKLAGGTYCARIEEEGMEIFLINGFHPKQLIHFTEPGRSIIAFTLIGNLDWQVARNNFIGKTNPSDAAEGSLRHEILRHREAFGLQAVSSSQNGFHLSAGPVEGLVELIRYCSDYDTGCMADPQAFLFGRQLQEHFTRERIQWICQNNLVEFQGEKIRTFDLTEEKNSLQALQLLMQCEFI